MSGEDLPAAASLTSGEVISSVSAAGNDRRVTPTEKLGKPTTGGYLEKSSSICFQAKLSAALCQVYEDF